MAQNQELVQPDSDIMSIRVEREGTNARFNAAHAGIKSKHLLREYALRRKPRKRVRFTTPLVTQFINPPQWYNVPINAPHPYVPEHIPVQQDNVKDDGLANEIVINRLVNHGYAEEGEVLFRVHWYGYGSHEDTWEPVHHLPRSYIVRYCKSRGMLLPANIAEAQTG